MEHHGYTYRGTLHPPGNVEFHAMVPVDVMRDALEESL